MTLAPDDPRHGTVNAYGNLKCRCAACREAWRTYPPLKAAGARWRSTKRLSRPEKRERDRIASLAPGSERMKP